MIAIKNLIHRLFPIANRLFSSVEIKLICFYCLQAFQPDNGGGLGSNGGAVSHFEPQVAMLCDSGIHGQESYHPKYMTEQGEWLSDLYSKATCFKDKMDILNYCKKVSACFI